MANQASSLCELLRLLRPDIRMVLLLLLLLVVVIVTPLAAPLVECTRLARRGDCLPTWH